MSRTPGITEHFPVGNRERVDRSLQELERLGVRDLRVRLSWARWCTRRGRAWYDYLLPRLGRRARLLPVCCDTPPALGIEPHVASPPRRPAAYAAWLHELVACHGEWFDWLELWDEPNCMERWDRRLDPDGVLFPQMIHEAARSMRDRGKKTVLGGIRPVDPTWLRRLAASGALDELDAIGIHACCGSENEGRRSWGDRIEAVREIARERGLEPEVWITEAGVSTHGYREDLQLRALVDACEAPAERIYWRSLYDADADLDASVDASPTGEVDVPFHHCGLQYADGRPKLAARLWQEGGLERVRAHVRLAQRRLANGKRSPVTVITGGAGFVGSNVAARLLRQGKRVVLLDNLSRPSIERNVQWLEQRFGDRVHLQLGDIRNPALVRDVVQQAEQVFHFAGQVAVTTSLQTPFADFDVNGRGTLHLLEALRAMKRPPPLLFTSTNKVYGSLQDIALGETATRWEPQDAQLRRHGVDEARPLDFHSPYGCSKGVADQYVLDYARTFGLRTVVFRMSCIYGTRQFGTEEQGWVAHFMSRAMRGEPLTVFGDGKQVRDVLFIDDLVEAMMRAMARIDALSGSAFNIGGGPERSISLLELVARLEQILDVHVPIDFRGWRPGDQRYYVSSHRRFSEATGWHPRHDVVSGLDRLAEWLDALHWEARTSIRPVGAPRPAAGVVSTRTGL